MTTPQESLETLRVALDQDAAALAAKALRLAEIHDRALERAEAHGSVDDQAPTPPDAAP